MKDAIIRCTCCGATEDQVDGLIQINTDNFICDVCSGSINYIFAERATKAASAKAKKVKMFPSVIKNLLDESIIGQEDAKKVLSVEVYNHYKRVNNPQFNIQKSNILMIGDSGTGKTLLVQTLSKILDLPMVIADMSLVTAAGYVGQDIESVLQQLVIAADGDVEKAQHGIVLLDEVDKIAKRNLTSSTEKDPSGEGVQQGLLKILEGTQVRIKVEGGTQKSRNQEHYIDTTNILFICAGAFFGLDKVLEKNHKGEVSSIGFSASVEKPTVNTSEIDEQDIIEYGFIPEFVGRLPVIVQLNKLAKEDYRMILTEPKNSIIDQYKKLMALDEISLEFTDEFLNEVVDKVYETKRGARALRTEIEKRMRNVIYTLNDESYGQKVTI